MLPSPTPEACSDLLCTVGSHLLPLPRPSLSGVLNPHLPPWELQQSPLPSAWHHSKNARKASVQHLGPIVLCLLHLAHHPCAGRCNGPVSKCGCSVVEVRARGEQGAGPPGERAPQTPHQAPGCRARKRRGPLTGLRRASPAQFGGDTTREPPGFPRGELQVRSDTSGLCSGFLEEATAEADPGGWVAP